jgi:PKD repeat protein|tara:strand:+ start:4183 stop:4482 length:300 start_codon:yes stop_codon:yes gene_type:complete
MSVTQNVAPVTINFNNTSQGDGLSYTWNFGDGQTSQQANPTHTFQAGVWEVTLTVTNDNGSDTSSTVIVATASSGGNGNQQQSGGVPQEIMTGGAGGLL